MALTSPLPLVLLMTVFLFIGHWVCRLVPFYARECAGVASGRYETIDGLRGYLALGVFFLHAVLHFQWNETGNWGTQPTGVYSATAHVAVALFFMITGFLFWAKVLRSGPRMDWKALYVSRIRRLAPLYLFSVALVLGIVAVRTDFQLNVSLRRFAVELMSWLTFSLTEPLDINGMKGTERINAGVLWTLAYEWKFYLGLPLLALFARGWKFLIVIFSFLTIYLFVPSERITFNFMLGMLVAHLTERGDRRGALRSRSATVVALACGLALLLPLGNWRVWLEPPLLFTLFMIIAHGNGLFGLLTQPAAKYLGTVSYSIYLLHGIFLYVALQLLDRFTPVSHMNAAEYWLAITGIGTAIVIGCGLSYRFIEYPLLATTPHEASFGRDISKESSLRAEGYEEASAESPPSRTIGVVPEKMP